MGECGECKHFERVTEQRGDNRSDHGTCHAHPPAMHIEGEDGAITSWWEFAVVDDDDFCGEFSPITPEPNGGKGMPKWRLEMMEAKLAEEIGPPPGDDDGV